MLKAYQAPLHHPIYPALFILGMKLESYNAKEQKNIPARAFDVIYRYNSFTIKNHVTYLMIIDHNSKQDLSAYRIAPLTAPCPSHKNFNVKL